MNNHYISVTQILPFSFFILRNMFKIYFRVIKTPILFKENFEYIGVL